MESKEETEEGVEKRLKEGMKTEEKAESFIPSFSAFSLVSTPSPSCQGSLDVRLHILFKRLNLLGCI